MARFWRQVAKQSNSLEPSIFRNALLVEIESNFYQSGRVSQSSYFSVGEMAARDACWWLSSWKKLDQEWQAACARGQQQLTKVADSVQKTTYLTGEHWGSLADCEQLQYRASSRVRIMHRAARFKKYLVYGIWHIGAASAFKMKWVAWCVQLRAIVALKAAVLTWPFTAQADIYARMQRLMTDDHANTLDEKRRQRYETILLEVLTMYEHELVAKSLIASDIFECFKHETVTIYLASWQMHPHIDRQRLEELETLIQNDLHYQTQMPRR
ncbi:hypothetical protein JG688_00007668 [Phytophthora aleatoria]|uniref:Uncharacterized protein n=1 Tax=Phytophthora aleatoria TaxID=2496075 RepID=A0A8J5IP85_9STRA|nr:hypothetical protein JG688_00007668 [Phytophthora aleatoria]